MPVHLYLYLFWCHHTNNVGVNAVGRLPSLLYFYTPCTLYFLSYTHVHTYMHSMSMLRRLIAQNPSMEFPTRTCQNVQLCDCPCHIQLKHVFIVILRVSSKCLKTVFLKVAGVYEYNYNNGVFLMLFLYFSYRAEASNLRCAIVLLVTYCVQNMKRQN